MTMKSEIATSLETTPSADPAYWTVPALAARWGLSEKTVYRMTQSGRLRVTRFGRLVRVAGSDLAAFEAKRRT